MDNTEVIESLELELDMVIVKAHNAGLNYWEILKAFLSRCLSLMAQAQSEYFLKGGQ